MTVENRSGVLFDCECMDEEDGREVMDEGGQGANEFAFLIPLGQLRNEYSIV